MTLPDPANKSTGTIRLVVVPIAIGLPLAALTVPAARAGFVAATLFVQWLLYAAWGWWALRTSRTLGFGTDGLFSPPTRARDWRYALLFVPLLVLCVSALFFQIALLSYAFPGLKDALLEPSPSEPSSPLVIALLTGLTGATLAPVVEELVFRGVLFRAWRSRFGHVRAMLGTSVLFGLLHHDVIGSVIFGIVMVMLYGRTGSLLVPVVTHALYNAVTQLFGALPDSDALTIAELRMLWAPSVIAMLSSIALIVLVFRERNHSVAGACPQAAPLAREVAAPAFTVSE
ncbi:MAG: type II CAAX endopeptidase family protein [bacterium]